MKALSEKQLACWINDKLHENPKFQCYSVSFCTFGMSKNAKVHLSSYVLQKNGFKSDDEVAHKEVDELIKQAQMLYKFEINREHT